MTEQALQTVEDVPAPVSESAAVLSLIERAASDPNVDIDKMERLMQMRQAMVNEEQRKQFVVAMSEAQNRMAIIVADKTNEQTNSMYASYAALDKVIRPVYTEHGFSLMFDTAPADVPEEIKVVCEVLHNGGHVQKYSIPVPVDGKGPKGSNVMTKTHAMISGVSYGRTALAKMIFNLAVSNSEDDDGNAAGGPFVLNGNQAKFMIRFDHISQSIKQIPTFRRLDNLRDFFKQCTFVHPLTVKGWLDECNERAAELDAALSESAKKEEAEDEWTLIAQMLQNAKSADELTELWESARVQTFLENGTPEQETSLKAHRDLCLGVLEAI